MGYLGSYLGAYVGSYLGTAGKLTPPVPPPSYEEFSARLELADNTAIIEIDPTAGAMAFVIKAGVRYPSITGRIIAPEDFDLEDVDFYMSYLGRQTAVRTVLIENLGEDETYEPPEDDEGEPLPLKAWKWRYAWQEGDTDSVDRYEVGISARVDGLLTTFPNDGWSHFYIRAQLSAEPVPE